MKQKAKSLRPFLGAKDFNLSRQFYQDLGFQEHVLSADMSVFILDDLAFYLQDYFVADWINNSMLFLEVEDVDQYWSTLQTLNLTSKYPGIKLTPIRTLDWGKECFIHDPSGILWHVGEFNRE